MRTRMVLGTVAVACVLAASASFGMAWRSAAAHRHLVPYDAHQSGGRDPGWTNPDALAGAAHVVGATVAAPVRVRIPAVGLSARVVPVGLTSVGGWQMPSASLAGWYRLGPAPGASGPAVLVGHVDSDRGPAVFYRLSGVRPGDTVQVARADGSRATFVISRVAVVTKHDFPTEAVFHPTARAEIRIVTCTGAFDPDAGGYADSLIVWGHATPRPQARPPSSADGGAPPG